MKKFLLPTALALMLVSGNGLSAPVDINTASAEVIAENLQGVGLNKARAIVDYRQKNGAFKHPDELVNVKGIGLKTVEKNIDRIKLGKTQSNKTG